MVQSLMVQDKAELLNERVPCGTCGKAIGQYIQRSPTDVALNLNGKAIHF